MKGRHGDVMIVSFDEKLLAFQGELTGKKVKGRVLVHGEATGHAHRTLADVDLYLDSEGVIHGLEVLDDTVVTHEEHHTRPVPTGKYRVILQREYDPDEVAKRVLD